MPTSFKQSIMVLAYQRTDPSELVFCSSCGGLNAMGNVAVKVDCTTCDGTGYENYFTVIKLPAYYRPGAVKRWNAIAGRLDYLGDCSIKVNAIYKDVIAQSQHLEFNGAQWSFDFLRDPGTAMGQPRLAFALTRKD